MLNSVSLSGFIAPPSVVNSELVQSPGFAQFYEQALKSSGEDPQQVDTSQVAYRYLDGSGKLHENQRLDDPVWAGGIKHSIRSLIAPLHSLDRKLLIHAFWSVTSIEDLKLLLRSLGAIVRYANAEDGRMVGHVLFADALIPMVESVERREYVLPNGLMASDAVTRTLGLRAKLFALDRDRRSPNPDTGGSRMIERLTRTLARIAR